MNAENPVTLVSIPFKRESRDKGFIDEDDKMKAIVSIPFKRESRDKEVQEQTPFDPNTMGFNSLQTGKQRQRSVFSSEKVECFRVSIPFKRESRDKVKNSIYGLFDKKVSIPFKRESISKGSPSLSR